jgi:hypothetical protein
MNSSLADMSKKLNEAGYVWAMVNYRSDGYWAVVKPDAEAEWIGDALGYNFDGESHATPEEALKAAAGALLS